MTEMIIDEETEMNERQEAIDEAKPRKANHESRRADRMVP